MDPLSIPLEWSQEPGGDWRVKPVAASKATGFGAKQEPSSMQQQQQQQQQPVAASSVDDARLQLQVCLAVCRSAVSGLQYTESYADDSADYFYLATRIRETTQLLEKNFSAMAEALSKLD